MKVRILKRMVSLGETLEVGAIVDASTWKNVKGLVGNRYVELVKDEPKAKAEPKVEAVEAKPKKAVKKDKVEE